MFFDFAFRFEFQWGHESNQAEFVIFNFFVVASINCVAILLITRECLIRFSKAFVHLTKNRIPVVKIKTGNYRS